MDYLIQGETLEGIANAIREKKGTTEKILPTNFAAEVLAIEAEPSIEIRGKIVEEVVETGSSVQAGDFVEKHVSGTPSRIFRPSTQTGVFIRMTDQHIFHAYESGDTVKVNRYTKTEDTWNTTSSSKTVISTKSYAIKKISLIRIRDNMAVVVAMLYSSIAICCVGTEKEDGSGTLSIGNEISIPNLNNNIDCDVLRVDDSTAVLLWASGEGSSAYSSYLYASVLKVTDGSFNVSASGFTQLAYIGGSGTLGNSMQVGINSCSLDNGYYAAILNTYTKQNGFTEGSLSVFHVSGVSVIVDANKELEHTSNKTTPVKLFATSNGIDTVYLIRDSTHSYYIKWDESNKTLSDSVELGIIVRFEALRGKWFYLEENLIQFNYDRITSYSLYSKDVKSTHNLPYAEVNSTFNVDAVSGGVFWIIKPVEEVVMEVQVTNGIIKDNGSEISVRPATSSQFMYGVAVEGGSSGDTIKIAIPSLVTPPEISLESDTLSMTSTDNRTEEFVILVDGVEVTTVEVEPKLSVIGTWRVPKDLPRHNEDENVVGIFEESIGSFTVIDMGGVASEPIGAVNAYTKPLHYIKLDNFSDKFSLQVGDNQLHPDTQKPINLIVYFNDGEVNVVLNSVLPITLQSEWSRFDELRSKIDTFTITDDSSIPDAIKQYIITHLIKVE